MPLFNITTRTLTALVVTTSLSFRVSTAHAVEKYDCLIEPTHSVDVRSPVTGRLAKVYVQRGDRVKEGQIVAVLESSVERASAELARYKSEMVGPVLTAQNKYDYSKRKYDRYRDMYQENFMSAQERDDAESELKLAESELQLATENRQLAHLEWQQQSSSLNLRTIRSPISGVVVDQVLYPGEVVEPGDQKKPILKLAQLDPLQVNIVLPYTTFGSVKVGTEALITPEPPVSGQYKGVVRSVDRLVDAASGTYVVLLKVPNPKLEIPAGIRCQASLVDKIPTTIK